MKNKKKTRIAMFSEAWKPIWGGGQEVALQLATELSHLTYSVDLFVMNMDGAGGVEEVTSSFRIHRVGKKRSWKILDRIAWYFELRKYVFALHAKESFDLLYAHSTLPGFYITWFKRKLALPTVLHVHGIHNLRQKKNRVFWLLEKILYTKTKYDLELTVSRDLDNFSNVNKPVFVANGVSTLPAVKKHGSAIKNIMFLGRFDYMKGVDILFKALEVYKSELERDGVTINLYGYGYDEAKLKVLCSELGLDSVVAFKGKISGASKDKAFREADAFILPSREEGLPLVLLEALSYGLPVLTTNAGEISSVVTDEVDALVCKAYSVDSLSVMFGHLLSLSASERSKLGSAGRKLISEKYVWSKIAKKVDKLLKTI